MDVPAVFRSTAPEVLEVHRENVAQGRNAAEQWRRFTEDTGLEPVIVYHPQGALVPGVHPSSPADTTTPPAGWFWDEARGLLAPALGSQKDTARGQRHLELLQALEWEVKPLPGVADVVTAQGITCLDMDDEGARLEAFTVAHRGERAALEAGGFVWLVVPHEQSDAVDSRLWERSRRFALEDALLELVPALEALRA